MFHIQCKKPWKVLYNSIKTSFVFQYSQAFFPKVCSWKETCNSLHSQSSALRMFPLPVGKSNLWSKEISQSASCQGCCCLAFVDHVWFCLTEHRQNSLSCSPGSGLCNQTHKHKAWSVSPSSVCSKWRVTASIPNSEPPHLFLQTQREREMVEIKDGESSRKRWMKCERRGFTVTLRVT